VQIKVISSRELIHETPVDEKIVHLSFRPSIDDAMDVHERCPEIEAIQIPRSYYSSVAKAVRRYCKENNIALLEGDVWGHRGDLYAYYNVPEQVIKSIKDMKALSPERIAENVSQIHKLSSTQAEYIVQAVLAEVEEDAGEV
jgi:hypothetical protein